jgi:hypothetical protein
MTLTERTARLLDRAALAEMPAMYRSLVIAMARAEGLESGELRRLPPRWWNIGRYEQECAEWEAIQPLHDADVVFVEPRDSLIEREQRWAVHG